VTRSPWLSVSILTIVLGSPALADPFFLSTRGATDRIVMPSRPGGGPGSGVNQETEATDDDILSAYDALGEPAKASEMWSEVESRLKSKLAPGHIAFAALALEQSLSAEERRDLPSAMDLANQAVAIAEASIKARREGIDLLPMLLVHRSCLELQQRRAGEAAADANLALKILQKSAEHGTCSSDFGRAYLVLARAFQAQGKRDEARTAFRSAAERFQNCAWPPVLLTP
jgi:tetratricopeptide (TPR) repeat protein